MGDSVLNVNVVSENKTISVPFNNKTTAEDVCIYVCKQLNISTVTRNLFALRISGKPIFLMPSATFTEKGISVDFRIRFKMPNIGTLEKLDLNSYNYYFLQARNDVLENKIPEIVYEKYRRELVGLGITDMYRVMIEKDIPRESVESDYKKFIPKEVLKRHPFFIRKPIHDTLGKLRKSGYDASYVKAEYLRQLQTIAPEYMAEFYKAVIDQNGATCSVVIKVSPYDTSEPGLKYSMDPKKEWHSICTIEEVGFISIRNDGTIEISRKNGIPFYLKFHSVSVMYSFISLVDGYYRLTCKWTFNICKDVCTPSLQKLYAMKCHGPVGGEFSYAKLELKRGNKAGCFIIRESESKYNSYYIDVCMKEGLKPKTFKLERINTDEFIFNDDLTRYKTIHELMTAYSDPNGAIYLQECLPPSEYDVSPLLLCRTETVVGDSLTDSSDVNAFMPSSPVCINYKNLQVYKGQRKEGFGSKTVIYRSMWKVTQGKKIEVAMKMLKPEYESYLKDFLTLAGQWCFLQSSAIVRLYGITFASNISFVMEYFRLGSLDQYLQKNRAVMKPVDLIEAASNLAAAVWHLAENDIVHGNIRCWKLLVYRHDENSFSVKLTDPGIFTSYDSSELPWLPVECYSNFSFAKRSFEADVWAFSTTLWEIFTLGKDPARLDLDMREIISGKRLPQPEKCLPEIYDIMKECWDIDPHKRKKPQAVSRDINQILYQIFNSRQKHSYAKIGSKSNGIGSSTSSLLSSKTASTVAVDDLMQDVDICSQSSFSVKDSMTNDESYDLTNFLSSLNLSTATTSLDSLNSMQSIFELDGNYNVVLQGRIGQGFYGEVYKGMLESVNREEPPRKVAIKKLKTTALSSCLQDFEREINIMKSLNHPNIVEILGVLREPEISLVMEFVHHGSLQSYLKIYKESLKEEQLLNYALDIAKGMDYLGTKNIVHRDLATRNILVVDENHVKISDFGLAQVMGTNDYYILKTPNRELPIKWYAPESLRDGKFSARSDVWSYGVTMCETFNYGEEPNLANIDEEIEGQQQQVLLNALEKGSRFPCPPECPTIVYVRIIYPCWEADPHRRPQFAKLVQEIEDLLSQY